MNDGSIPGGVSVSEIVQGATVYWMLLAGLDLGVFDVLAAGPTSDEELARRVGAQHERLTVLLDGLVAARLIGGDHRARDLPSWSEATLVSDRPGYLGGIARWSQGLPENWSNLSSTVRGEQPPRPPDARFHAHLAPATFDVQLALADDVVSNDLPELGNAPRIVDVGAGLGPWAVAFLGRFPEAVAVVIDRGEVLELARAEIERRGLVDRVAFLPGDYHAVDIPEGDVVVLGHVCRAEGAARAPGLIARAAASVAQGGSLVLTDYLVDETRRGPRPALLLGVTMLANTGVGATFTSSQFCAWLGAAGFEPVAQRSSRFGDALVARRSPS